MLRRRRRNRKYMEAEARKFAAESMDNGGEESRIQRLYACDPHFSGGWVGQKFDLFDAMSEFIEHDGAPAKQRAAVDSKLDAFHRTIDEPHLERALKIGNHLLSRRRSRRVSAGARSNAEVSKRAGQL
jgi:hypothetical protein